MKDNRVDYNNGAGRRKLKDFRRGHLVPSQAYSDGNIPPRGGGSRAYSTVVPTVG
jgi:hypothetical protein